MTRYSRYDILTMAEKFAGHLKITTNDQFKETINFIEDYLKEDDKEKSESNLINFINSYCVMENSLHGVRRIELYNYQKVILESVLKNKFLVINIARQMGITSLIVYLSLFYLVEGKSSIVITDNLGISEEMISRMKLNIQQSDLLRRMDFTANRNSIICGNSEILCMPMTENCLIGRNPKLINNIFVDNAAYISYKYDSEIRQFFEKFEGKVVITSTPNKKMGMFYDYYQTASKIDVPWFFHPERVEDFPLDMYMLMSEDVFKQQYQNQFLD